jgi:ABC-2 type transport system ATP-binding protein
MARTKPAGEHGGHVQDGSGRIVVQNLTKHFGQVAAVQNLSFHVEPGSVTGFLGPNGSGKTTTLRMLLGLVRPTSGWATINGQSFDKLDNPGRIVGGVLEAQGFHPSRTARDHLRVYAAAMGVPDPRADEVLNLVGLAGAGERAAGGFSLGMKQRLALATALLGDPQVLVLDEPANGLDPEGIAWLRTFLKAFAQSGRTVLISSHLLAEVEQTIDQVVIISRGQTMYYGPLEELRNSQQTRVVVQPADPQKLAIALQEAKITNVTPTPDGKLAVVGATIQQVGDVAAREGIALYGVHEERADLEQMFFRLTSGQYSGQMPPQSPGGGWGGPPPGGPPMGGPPVGGPPSGGFAAPAAAPGGYQQQPSGYQQVPGTPPGGYPQPTGAPGNFQEPGVPGGYQQHGAPGGYQQPGTPEGYQQAPGTPPGGYQQPGTTGDFQQPAGPAGYQQAPGTPPGGYPQAGASGDFQQFAAPGGNQQAPGTPPGGYQQPGTTSEFQQPAAPGGYQQVPGTAPGGYQQAPSGYQQAPGAPGGFQQFAAPGYQQAPGGYQQPPADYQQPGTGGFQQPGYQQAPGTPPGGYQQPSQPGWDGDQTQQVPGSHQATSQQANSEQAAHQQGAPQHGSGQQGSAEQPAPAQQPSGGWQAPPAPPPPPGDSGTGGTDGGKN